MVTAVMVEIGGQTLPTNFSLEPLHQKEGNPEDWARVEVAQPAPLSDNRHDLSYHQAIRLSYPERVLKSRAS